MNSMIKSIAAKVISHFFVGYIDKINSSQLELEIWNGKVRLENVQIVPNALASHQLPFTVKHGTIGSISLVLPWNRLSSQPCVVDINDIFIVATVSGNVIISKDLEAKQDISKLYKDEDSVSESGSISSLLSKVIDNIQFHIKNLHIRIELNVNDKIVAMGATISSINAFSINEALEFAFIPTSSAILRKKAEISELAFYIDPDRNPIPEDNFSQIMMDLIHSPHRYVLRPFTFFGILYFNRSDNTNSTDLVVNTKTLDLALDALQWNGLMELERQYEMFNTRRKYSHCGKPTNYPRSQRSSGKWWRYAHRCAIEKVNKLSFDPQNAFDILSNRQKYLHLVEAGTKEEVKAFEKQFDLQVILFLRNYTNVIRRNKITGANLTSDEIEEVLKEQKKIKQYKIFNLNLNMESLSVSVLTQDLRNITRLITNQINVKYFKKKFNTKTDISIEKVSMYNDISKMLSTPLTTNGKIELSLVSKPNKPKDINFVSNGISLYIDLQFINEVVNFFKKERKFIHFHNNSTSSVTTQIQTVIDQHVGVNLNLNLNDTSIILPYQEVESCPILASKFQSISIISAANTCMNANDYQTLYDRYTIQVQSSMLMLNDNDLLTKSFNTNIQLDVAIVESDLFEGIKLNCEFDPIFAKITTMQALIIVNTIFYLQDSFILLMGGPFLEPKAETDSIVTKSADSFLLKFAKINFEVDVGNKKAFEVETGKFSIECINKETLEIITGIGPIVGTEYITDSSDNRFLTIQNIHFKLNNDIEVSIKDPVIYAKQRCLKYLLALAMNPTYFERTFSHNENFDISHFYHKSLPVPPYKVILNMSNFSTHISNEIFEISRVLIEEFSTTMNFDKIFTLQLGFTNLNIKNEYSNFILPFETLFELTPILIRFHLSSNATFNINFSIIESLWKLYNEIMPPIQETVSIPSTEIKYHEFDIKSESINGKYKNIELSLTDFQFNGNYPRDLNVQLKSLQSNLYSINLLNLTDLNLQITNSISISNESNIGFDQLINDKLNNIELLSSSTFDINKSSISLSAFTFAFAITTHLLDEFPPINKLKALLPVVHRGIEHHSNEVQKGSHIMPTDYQLDIEMFSISLYESNNNILCLTLNQCVYSDQIIKINLFSIVSDNKNTIIASSNQNFLSFSSKSNLILIEDTEINISYELTMKLVQFIMQFSELSQYYNLFSHNKSVTTTTNNAEIIETKGKSYTVECKKMALSIEENHYKLYLSAGFHYSTDVIEVNNIMSKVIIDGQSFNLVQPFSISYYSGIQIRKINVTPIKVNFALGDIDYITNMVKRITSAYVKTNNFDDPKERSFNFIELLPKNIEIESFKAKIDLCFNDRTPFVALDLDNFRLSTVHRTQFLVVFSFIYYNANSGLKDQILERMEIAADSSITNNDQKFNVTVSPIILNLHIPFIRRLIYFNNCRKNHIKAKENAFEFVNLMGSPLKLKVGNEKFNKIMSGSSVPCIHATQETEVSLQCEIIICNRFIIGEIFHPMALSTQCFVYRENNRIFISSPYIFKNSLDFSVSIFTADYKKIGSVRPNEKLPISPSFDITKGIYLIEGDVDSIFAVVRSASAHHLASIVNNIPLSSERGIANSRSTEMLGVLANTKPLLFNLDSWASSKPKAYSLFSSNPLIDNTMILIHQKITKKFIGVIQVSTLLTVVNQLPFDITFKLVRPNFQMFLKTGQSVPVHLSSFDYSSDEIIKCQIGSFQYGISSECAISYKDDTKSEIVLQNMNRQLSLIVQASLSHSGITNLYIYSPSFLNNLCGFPLNIRNKRSSASLILCDSMLWCAPSFIEKNTLKIQIQCREFGSRWQKEKIDCTAVGIASTIFLPTSNESIFVPINASVNKATTPFDHTTVITFSPSLVVRNELRHAITLNPYIEPNNFGITIRQGEEKPIPYSTNDSRFILKLEGQTKTVNIILASPTRKVFRIEHAIIEMETVNIKGCLLVHFRKARMPTPMVFCNLLTIPFSVYQTDKANQVQVMPMTSTGFPYDDPNGENKVVATIGNFSITLILSCNCVQTKIKNTPYFVEIKTAGKRHRMLILSDKENPPYIGPTIHFSLTIKDILVSLINQNMIELCLISFHELIIKITNKEKNSLYEIMLDSVHIDDQLNTAPFPIFLLGESNDNARFLHLSAVCLRDAPLFSSFENLSFAIQKISIYADLAFISDMIAFYFAIFDEKKDDIDESLLSENIIKDDNMISLEKQPSAFDAPPSLPMSYSSSRPLFLPEDTKTVGQIISFSNLLIHPCIASITFRGVSGRPMLMQRHELSTFLIKLIPNITNATLRLNSFEVQNFLAPIALLKEMLLNNYKNEIVMQWWKIAGHSDIFFNAFGIVESFGQGVTSIFYDPQKADVESPEKLLMITKGGTQLIFGTLGSIVQGGEGFIKNVSNYLSLIGEDDANAAIAADHTNLEAADTIQEGFKSLGNSFYDGFNGLIRKPIEGGKKDGIAGAFSGLTKGLIGAIAKPTAGVLGMSASVIGGIRKAISSDDILRRFREPNAYPFMHVGGFNKTISLIQNEAKKRDKKRYYSMRLLAISFANNYIYALFDKGFFVFERKEDGIKFFSNYEISQISDITQIGNSVRFKVNDENLLKFDCETQETAEKFVLLLCSLESYSLLFN